MAKAVFYFGDRRAEGSPARPDLLGAKGAGLAEMTLLGLPVPPGFTIAATVCHAFLETRRVPEDARREVDAALARLEGATGARLGDAAAPLLVSVRSGASTSMPGMMDTILNLGLNDEIVRALAARTDSPRFAFDTYRRFLAAYANIALGVSKGPFEQALEDARGRVATSIGIDGSRLNAEELKRRVPDADIPADVLEGLVSSFKAIVKSETGRHFPSDPREQLWQAISAIFESSKGARALAFRNVHDIGGMPGTACTIQAMVFGNLGETSATGVAFTRDPSTGEKRLFGEWLPNAQGEDIVSGIRTPFPLRSLRAAVTATGRASVRPDESLETRMPDTFHELDRTAATLERHFRDMQDIEFTVENGRLYVLQCRTAKRSASAAVRIAVEMAKEGLVSREEAVLRIDPEALEPLLRPTLDPTAETKLLARGLPASPGAASGHIVFDLDEAERSAVHGEPVILVRRETSPEDIRAMTAARGILTARGGMTSHAAVVARGLGKPCVAGVSAMGVNYETQTITVAAYDDAGQGMGQRTLKKGDVVTIDGDGGHVYDGIVPTFVAALSGELGELLSWADTAARADQVFSRGIHEPNPARLSIARLAAGQAALRRRPKAR